MKKQVIDFTGIDVYVGLDVHKKNWSVSIIVDDLVTKTFTQDPCTKGLMQTLEGLYPNATFHLVYEAGFSGFKVQRELTQAGHDCIVVHPPEVPSTDRDRKRKNDRLDSRKLAKLLSSGVLSGIHILTPQQEASRSLIRLRQTFRKDLTRVQNRIKSFLNFLGIEIPAEFSSRWTKAFVSWLHELVFEDARNRLCLDMILTSYLFAKKQLAMVDKKIKEMAQSPEFADRVKSLTSTPGIGLTSAMVLLTEIADIRRFCSRDHFCSFAGIVPNFHNSGDRTADGSITMRRNASVRKIIIECAWVAIRHDPALTLAYKSYKKRMAGPKAIVKIARKLLARIRHLLLHNETYQIGVVS